MRRVRSKNTGPERKVRSMLFALGLRFRLHSKDLPGTPDIILPKYRIAVLVHGCFWHRHPGCHRSTLPSTRTEFWHAKFTRTIARDTEQCEALHAIGWRPVVIWECELRREDELRSRLAMLFGKDGGRSP